MYHDALLHATGYSVRERARILLAFRSHKRIKRAQGV